MDTKVYKRRRQKGQQETEAEKQKVEAIEESESRKQMLDIS